MADNEDGGRNGPVGRTDRISRLPDEIKELILGFLPITHSVRTSALSRNWRFSWTKAEQVYLDFGEDAEEQMATNVGEYMIGDEYCRIVGTILLSHSGPIRKLVMGPGWNDLAGNMKGWRYLDCYMPTWLHILSRKGIRDLTIHFKPERAHDYIFPGNINLFDMPSSLFRCLELSVMSLRNSILRDSAEFRGFPNLVTLALSEVVIYDNILEKIVNGCALEKLYLESCSFVSGRTVIKAPHLKIFKVIYYKGDPCYLEFTPTLRAATFEIDVFDEMPDTWNLNGFDILSRIPIIEDFTFDCRLHKFSGSNINPKTLPELQGCLKVMTLLNFYVSSMNHIYLMLCIIRSSPHLQNLSIKLSGEQTSAESFVAAIENLKTVSKEEIKTNITTLTVSVKTLNYVKHISTELAFIAVIVSRSQFLQTLEIKSPSSMKESINLELSEVLEQLGEPSRKPKIIHSFPY